MMASITSLRTRTLLAKPTALRPSTLFGALPSTPGRLRSIQPRSTTIPLLRQSPIQLLQQPRSIQARPFSASSSHQELVKFQHVASLLMPEFRTEPLSVIRPDDFFKGSSLLSAPDADVRREMHSLFTNPVPSFLYAEGDFYKMRENTKLPEVCILGRSNIGKSTFINAIASRRKKPIAARSSKPGSTKSMNSYGFGPPKELTAEESRSGPPPTHTFYMVDMPGYGHGSLASWGENIALYLHERDALKGAILLIDAEVGPKPSDALVLQLLCEAKMRTAVVLAKADKCKRGLNGLREVSMRVRDIICKIDQQDADKGWVWDREIYVTALGSPNLNRVKLTTPIARLAVARLAGLTKDEKPNDERNAKWSGKPVSFDDLQYAAGESAAAPSAQPHTTSPDPDMEGTPNVQVKDRTGTGQAFKAQESSGSRGFSTRAFHSASFRALRQSISNKAVPADTRAALDELLRSLQIKPSAREALRRVRQKRDGKTWAPDPRSFDHEPRTPGERHPDMVRSAEEILERHRTAGADLSQRMDTEKFEQAFGSVPEPVFETRTTINAKQGPSQDAFDAFDMGFGQVPAKATGKVAKQKLEEDPFESAFGPLPDEEPKGKSKKKSKKKGKNNAQTRASKAEEKSKARSKIMDADMFQAIFEGRERSAESAQPAEKTGKRRKRGSKKEKSPPPLTKAAKAMERTKERNQLLDASAFEAIFAGSSGLQSKKK